MSIQRRMTRRSFVRAAALSSAGVLSACAPKIVRETVVVEKEVEKLVKETVVVKEAVEVQKEVTRVVEKVVQQPASTEKVTLRWGRHVNASEQPVYEYMQKDFTARYPNVELVVEEVPWADYFQKLLTQTAGGTPPDVMWVGSLWIPQFWAKGVVRNLSAYIDASTSFSVDDYFPKWMEYMYWGGSIYYLPTRGATMGLYYNKNLFDQAGVEYPQESWKYTEEFLMAAQKLTVKEGGRTKQWGCFLNPKGQAEWFNMFPTFDASILSEDNCTCTLDQQNAIDAYQFMADLGFKYEVNIKPGEVDTPSAELFETGRIAMYLGGCPSRVQFEKNITSFDWDVAMPPQGPRGSRGSPGWYGGTAMACKSKQDGWAWQFLQYQHSYETQVQYAKIRGFFPMHMKAAEHPDFVKAPPANAKVFLDMTPYAAKDPMTTMYSQVRSIFLRDQDLIVSGERTAAEVFPALKKELDPLLEEGCKEAANAKPCG